MGVFFFKSLVLVISHLLHPSFPSWGGGGELLFPQTDKARMCCCFGGRAGRFSGFLRFGFFSLFFQFIHGIIERGPAKELFFIILLFYYYYYYLCDIVV